MPTLAPVLWRAIAAAVREKRVLQNQNKINCIAYAAGKLLRILFVARLAFPFPILAR
jgi:hypothetical protein